MRNKLIYHIKNAYSFKEGDNTVLGKESIRLLERTIFNKYIGKKSNNKKSFSKEKQEIPEDLIGLFLHAAKYYRLQGDLDRAEQILDKIKSNNRYKKDLLMVELLQEEVVACELSKLNDEKIPSMKVTGKSMQDLLQFLKDNGIPIDIGDTKIFSKKDGVGNRGEGNGNGKEGKYPESLNAFSRLQFFFNSLELESVKIVNEGGFKGTVIFTVKNSEVSFIESFFDDRDEESYGKATYIVPSELIGSYNLEGVSRTTFKKDNKGKIKTVNHAGNYYENFERHYEEMCNSLSLEETEDIGESNNAADKKNDAKDSKESGKKLDANDSKESSQKLDANDSQENDGNTGKNDIYTLFEEAKQTLDKLEQEIQEIQRGIDEKVASRDELQKEAEAKRGMAMQALKEADEAERIVSEMDNDIEVGKRTVRELRERLKHMTEDRG